MALTKRQCPNCKMDSFIVDIRSDVPLPDLNADLHALVSEKLRFIAGHRERLIEAWIAETGAKPSESVLVEDRTNPMMIKVWVERRADGG